MRRAIAGFILLASCTPRPRQATFPDWPVVTTQSSHYAGSVISGPAPTDVPADGTVDHPLIARVRWAVLARMPGVPSVPLQGRVRLLLAPTGSPLLGAPALTEGVRLVEGPEAATLSERLPSLSAAEGRLLADQLSAVPPGVTGIFAATVVGESTRPAQDIQLRLSAQTPPVADDNLHLAYTVSDPGAAGAELPFQQHSETAVFDQPAAKGRGTLVLLVPLPSKYPSGTVLATSVQVRPATAAAADRAAVARCDADLQQSAAGFAGQPSALPVGISQSAGLQSALAALDRPDQRRASMTYLADQAKAPLCLDVAITADNATAADLAHSVIAALHASDKTATSPNGTDLGWILDRTAFQLLTNLADSPEGGKLTPELSTVLTQYAGEAARHPPALDEIAHGVSGEKDLNNRIVAQNFLFLSDPSPAARVRAFDWLTSRHLAPAGYDPLGSPRDRRRAINRATSQP